MFNLASLLTDTPWAKHSHQQHKHVTETPYIHGITIDIEERTRKEHELDSLSMEERLKMSNSVAYAVLNTAERWWRDVSSTLLRCGYRLRGRYQPNWQASWLTSGEPYFMCEDGCPPRDLVSVSSSVYLMARLKFRECLAWKYYGRHPSGGRCSGLPKALPASQLPLGDGLEHCVANRIALLKSKQS
jgi:hypothetical protein